MDPESKSKSRVFATSAERSAESLSNASADESDEPSLQALENAGFISIIEDALDQIIMLGSAENMPDVSRISLNIDTLKNRCAKYSKNDPVYNCLNGEIFKLTLSKMKYLKLHLDRAFLEHILTVTREELYMDNSFDQLKVFLYDFTRSEQDEQTLISDQNYNKAYATALKTAVKKKIEESQKEIAKTNEQIARCKDEMESFLFDNALKIRYIENWENARIEQGYMECDLHEGEHLDTINKYKNEIEKEIRINAEIVNYIAENQKDMEEAIENWMKRYETELDEKQIQLTLYKEKRTDQKNRYEEMKVTYEVHAKEIEDWLDYKEKKRKREELEKKRYDAACRIQSWWRKTMFRLKIGPWDPDPEARLAKLKAEWEEKKKKEKEAKKAAKLAAKAKGKKKKKKEQKEEE